MVAETFMLIVCVVWLAACSMAMFKVAPSILNASQIAKYAATQVQRQLGRKVPAYKPNFTECLDHFLIHAGVLADLGLAALIVSSSSRGWTSSSQ